MGALKKKGSQIHWNYCKRGMNLKRFLESYYLWCPCKILLYRYSWKCSYFPVSFKTNSFEISYEKYLIAVWVRICVWPPIRPSVVLSAVCIDILLSSCDGRRLPQKPSNKGVCRHRWKGHASSIVLMTTRPRIHSHAHTHTHHTHTHIHRRQPDNIPFLCLNAANNEIMTSVGGREKFWNIRWALLGMTKTR